MSEERSGMESALNISGEVSRDAALRKDGDCGRPRVPSSHEGIGPDGRSSAPPVSAPEKDDYCDDPDRTMETAEMCSRNASYSP